MNNQIDFVSLSDILNVIPGTEVRKIDQIIQETDLRKQFILLTLYQNGINTGINAKTDFQLDFLLKEVSNENIADVCKVLKCALMIQSTNDECLRLIEKYSDFSLKPICLNNLKIMNILLDTMMPTNNLLSTYLHYSYNSSDEYKYFVSNLLPNFLKSDKNSLNLIWEKCYGDKSLVLLSSIPSTFLFSETYANILKQDQFWELLVHELVVSDGFQFKAAMFLLKLSLDVLRKQKNVKEIEYNEYINEIILNNDKSMDYFCILLDVAREKQLHLIEPSLHLLNKLNLPNIWLNIIYRKLLCHPHNAVAYNTLIYYMKQFERFRTENVEFGALFIALNKNEDSKLSKQVLQYLQQYSMNLRQDAYEKLLSESLNVGWNPVAFYNFYKNTLVRPLDLNITLEIIKNCKKLPHRYIRQGVMSLVFTKLKHDLKEKVSIGEYMNIILELMLDDSYYKYATKLINLSYLTIPNEFINELLESLNDPSAPNIRIKVDFLVQITERKTVPDTLVKNLYEDFKNRKYAIIILDRLSYLYLIKPSDLQDYLLERLNSTEETHSIRHMDKPSYDLISKSISVLSSEKSSNQQLLAFEVLFYMTKSNYNHVYNHWFNKILHTKEQIAPILALNFVNLLIKVPSGFGRQNFARLLDVYEVFFNCQRDDVIVRIYRNFDFILENVDTKHLQFVECAYSKIFYLKAREDVENSVRYLVRNIALNYKSINKAVLEFLLRKLYDSIRNESASDFVIYYTSMYFKYLNFDISAFPMYEFLLYPNCILNKNERAEYEICTEIYMNLHVPSPYFRAAEIRKWALEDLLFDENPTKIKRTVTYLLENYKKTFNKRYFPDSTLHLHKLRTMQIFIFLLSSISKDAPLKDRLVTFLMESFVQESHQPSVRLLMQYLLTQLLKEEQSALELLLKTLETSDKMHTSTITSFMPVIYGLDLSKNNPDFSHKVVDSVLVWTMGPHFKLRYYAQKLIHEVCIRHQHNFKFKKYDAIFKAVETSIKATTIKDDLDFDIVSYIFNEKPWKDNKKLIYIMTVHIPEVCNVTPCEWEYFKVKQFWSKYLSENLQKDELKDLDSFEQLSLNESGDNIQKKIVPWQDALVAENETKISSNRNLIIVTSLIESGANLGGLSRTCEIFGGHMLVVDNIKVVEKKEFSNLSMTSEKWLNITEVKAQNLPEFLKKCKDDNYKIVGIEQTSESSSLNNYKFEERTVLLLGNERAGIPANLIGLMDDCVEIPQFGMIRSLNVHVAGAVVIWEYTKQQMIKRATNMPK